MSLVKIHIECIEAVNYALYHNKLPIYQDLLIENLTDEPLEDIKLTVDGEFFKRYESEPFTVDVGETVRVEPFEISPDPVELIQLTERVATRFTLTVLAGEEEIHSEQREVILMAYDQWLDAAIMPQSLASFATPNHPAIIALIPKVADVMKQISGESCLSGYQSGDPNEVRMQVASVFAAIHKQGIVYKSVPPGYEDIGQRVTMPDQVLATKTGNCIELTLLFATVLEAISINSGIVCVKGHAYLGVWLVDKTAPSSYCDDVAFLSKAISKGVDEMLVLECTCVTNENTGFEDAVAAAERNLANFQGFDAFIDIQRCRMEGIRPLPTRVPTATGWDLDTTGVEHGECDTEVKPRDRFDLSHIVHTAKKLDKFDIWERKLLEFSLRNTLLNLSVRSRAAQIISFDIDRIEDHLQDGEEYCVVHKPVAERGYDFSDRLVHSKMYKDEQKLVRHDIEQHRLHTYLTEGETRLVLRNIYRTAKNSLEETGANSLFLAIGMLRWYETPQSRAPRYAPILLLPVEMVYKKGNYYIRTRDEGIALNITLKEFLIQNYEVNISGLDTLPRDESGVDVPLVFAALRDALKDQARWDVEEECVLGNFSFSKFLMWNDIHRHRDKLLKNDVINSLVQNRLTWIPQPVTTQLKELDQQISPLDLALPVPIDSSQMAAVIEAGKCNSFILYGPPGTGKSQTITNLISNALYQGKRVLFVAEKMAALSVVQRRLEKIGLGPFCLELHSNKSTKRHVLQQLAMALKVAHIMPPAEHQVAAEKIFAERKTLIAYMNALHEVDAADGMSLYDCILRYVSTPGEPLAGFAHAPEVDALVAREGVKGVEELLGGEFETVVRLVGQPSEHPLNGMRVDRSLLMNSDGALAAMRGDRATIAEAQRLAADLGQTKSLREKLLRDNSPEILTQDAARLYHQWRAAKAKWFLPRALAKRAFVSKLKSFNPFVTAGDIDALLDNLLAYAERHARIEQLRGIITKYFGIDTAADELPDAATLDYCAGRLDSWQAHAPLMRDWLHWSEYRDRLASHGLLCVAEAMQQEPRQPSDMRQAYVKALMRHKIEERLSRSEVLATFEGMLFDAKIQAYKRMTEEFQLLTQRELYARLASRVPRASDNLDSGSEIGLLNRNISNGGRGLSLRDLFDQLPTLMPRLCPCMLMSPMSVAQYLDLGAEKFDLVVFDEASQMPTSESIGAIARGKALVVVGDPKQMPPTSFFASSNVDEEEVALIDDMESILEDCQTLGMSPLQLSWHYRSRHESLIAFSNNEYYEGSLITFPSADDQHTKVHHVPVKGYYDKGGRRQNKAEAEAIVKEIARRLADDALRQKSIGVIAFSVAQQSLIEDTLQTLLDNNAALAEAAKGMHEPIFVKNLENVQGDERDVILFSIGYGPDKSGKVSMNFGPLNNTGGERRLNVAVSRSREEMYIFSTLKSADIDLRRTKSRGVEGLKHFLAFAESQSLPTLSSSQAPRRDNLLARQIAQALEERGYAVKTNVGRSQFRVDVAVGDKGGSGVYTLGILLDGEGYRDTHTTRDREIVQPSVLGGLRWQVMRVWSVDWYNNPGRVLERIEERIAAAPPAPEPLPAPLPFDIADAPLEEPRGLASDYTPCQLTPDQAQPLDDWELVAEILTAEQPMTFTLLCRRYNALRQGGRVTATLQKKLRELLPVFYQDADGSIWASRRQCDSYQGYRADSGREIAEIPPVELRNALLETLAELVAVDPDTLISAAAKKLGFARRGANVYAAFADIMQRLEESGATERVGPNIRLKEA